MLPLVNSSYFQDMLESFTYGVLICNTRGEIYAVNTYASYMLEEEKQAFTGSTWQKALLGLEHQDELHRFMKAAMSRKACPLPFHTRLQREGGATMHLSLQTSQLVVNDKIFGVLVSMADVSGVVQAHEREKRSMEKAARLQLERVEGLKRLAMGVAHQIRNPVMTIGGFTNLLERKLDGAHADYLDALHEAGERLEAIVNAMSDYTGATKGAAERVDVTALLERLAGECADRIGPNAMRVEAQPDLPELWTDSGLLQNALRRVLENAVQAVAESGSVTLGAKREDGRCVFTVADDGPGIAEEHRPYVFDPFYTTSPSAVGMGLTTARRIMREMGGDVRLECSGPGVTASLWLPWRQPGPAAGREDG